MASVIDVHTHMYTEGWLELLKSSGGPDYEVKESPDSPETIFYRGASFGPLESTHFDYEARIRNMDEAKVDIAVLTLPTPSVFWGGEKTSAEAAATANDEFRDAQEKFPERIKWMASLPWEYPDAAVEELTRACANGAVGILALGNINGKHLTDDLFSPIWQAIDDHALPVLIHPAAPPGVRELGLAQYAMVGSIGFMIDTSVAIVRMIGDAFFETYPNFKLVAAHAGATLPYLAGRLDRVYETTQRARAKISKPPTEYLKHIYYDSVCYTQDALEMCIRIGGSDKVLYGSDYPYNFGDMKGILTRVNALKDDGVRDAVRGDNAKRIFGI